MAAESVTGSDAVGGRWKPKRGHLNALLFGGLLGQVGFWLWFSVHRITVEQFGTDDFAAFWSIASLALDGHASQIYDLPAVAALQASLGLPQTVPFFYPPFFVLFVLPFGLLSPGLGYLLWGCANMALLGLAIWLLARDLVPREDRLTFALLVASSMPAGRNLYLGQTAFFLLLGFGLAAISLLKGRDRTAGLASTLLLIKPQLLPLWVLALLLCRRFTAIVYLVLGGLVLMLVSTAIVGIDGMAGYVRSLLFAGGSDGVGFQAVGSHTLAGLAYTLVGETAVRPAYISMVALTVALFCWWMLRLNSSPAPDLRLVAGLAVLASLLVSPHSLLYDLSLWAIPMALYWGELSTGRGRWVTAAGYLTPWLVSFFGMLGAGFVWPTVAVGALGYFLLGRKTESTLGSAQMNANIVRRGD